MFEFIIKIIEKQCRNKDYNLESIFEKGRLDPDTCLQFFWRRVNAEMYHGVDNIILIFQKLRFSDTLLRSCSMLEYVLPPAYVSQNLSLSYFTSTYLFTPVALFAVLTTSRIWKSGIYTHLVQSRICTRLHKL